MARLAVTVSLSLDNATCIYRRQSLPCLFFAKTTLIHRLTDRHLASKKDDAKNTVPSQENTCLGDLTRWTKMWMFLMVMLLLDQQIILTFRHALDRLIAVFVPPTLTDKQTSIRNIYGPRWKESNDSGWLGQPRQRLIVMASNPQGHGLSSIK